MSNARVPSTLNLVAEPEAIKLEAVDAADGEQKLRKFSGVAYTGAKVNVGGWPYPVVTDLAGVSVTKKARPILRDHDTSKIVGHTEGVALSARQINVDGIISAANEHAAEVIQSSENGFPWQMSIGASVQKAVFLEDGETASVNGRKVAGPAYIVRQSSLNEISFVALGADDHTSAKVAASAANATVGVIGMAFDKWLVEQGVEDGASLPEKAMGKLRQQYDLEQKPAPLPNAPTDPGKGFTNPKLEEVVQRTRDNEERCSRIGMIAAEKIQESPSQLDQINGMAQLAMQGNKSPETFELELLRALRPQTGGMTRRGKDSQVSQKVLEAALCMSGGLSNIDEVFDEQTLEFAHKNFRAGLGLSELILMAARENGCTALSMHNNLDQVLRYAVPSDVRQSGFSTISLPGILSNVANKFLIDAFNAVEDTWRRITAIRPVRDFKQITSYSLTGDLDYKQVGASGDIKHGTLAETSYTNQANTYARMSAITRRDLINDDLGAFTAINKRMGRGGAQAVNNVFWAKFLNNSTFFTAGRNNFDDGGTDTPFSPDNLIRADAMFRQQTDPDGKPLAAMPRILLVPPGLRIAALRLMNSQTVYKDTDAGGSNPWSGAFQVESSVYLANAAFTGYSALAWYLLADPNDIPVIETCFLGGREQPVVEISEADFSTLGIQVRGYHDFGCELQEYRGGVKFKGEA